MIKSFPFLLLAAIFVNLSAQAETPSSDILVIGDSHICGSFGASLVQKLSASGANVDVYCANSSAPNNWLKGTTPPHSVCETWSSSRTGSRPTRCEPNGKVPSLESILAKKHYANVVVALGTNTLLSPKADRSYADLAQTIHDKDPGASCSWIGPPHLRSDEAKGFPPSRLSEMEKNLNPFYTSLKKTVSSCHVINSRASTATGQAGSRTRDGVHRNDRAGAAWATQVAGDFNQATCTSVLNKTMQSSKMNGACSN